MKSYGNVIRTNSEWVFIKTDPELSDYYIFVLKKYGINLKPTGLPHITVVASKYETYDGPIPDTLVEFEIRELLTDGDYYWLDIYCPWIQEFRESVGLNPNLKYDPHLTLGRLDLSWGRQKVKRIRNGKVAT